MSDSVGQWVSVSEAAAAAGTSDRTVWRWVHSGVVESKVERRGQRDVRLINAVSLPPSDSDSHRPTASSDTDSQRPTPSDSGVESQGLKTEVAAPAPAECPCCKVRESEVGHLRAQIDRRAEEAAMQAEAERELRLMMMQLERTNAELAASLCVKALPPAPDPEPPRRVRWWARIWGTR
jgi:hypothetical protein